ncbi:unnamed protein product, partial [marine sediment metagenome]
LRIKELIDWGVEFDKKPDGQYDLAREGGHTEHRILHHKDNTGLIIQESISKRNKREKSAFSKSKIDNWPENG